MNTPSAPPSARRSRRSVSTGLGLAAACLLTAGIALSGMAPAHAAEAPVDLGAAAAFSVLAGSTVTNTGPSTLGADLGVTPGSAITGFSPGKVLGTVHAADAVANTAQSALTAAYDDAAGRSTTTAVAADLAGQTLTSGVYTSPTLGLTDTVTLDAQGDPNAVFIFQSASTLITASNSTVALINGASPCNVYWQVGSSATLGTGTEFAGTLMALTSATLNTGANVNGRILARNGAVTLDTNVITAPNCAAAPPAPSGTPAPTTAPSTAPPTATPSSTPPTSTPSTTPPTTAPPATSPPTPTPPTATPPVPVGHPPTGLGGAEQQGGNTSTVLYVLAALALAGAVAASALRTRATRRH